MTNSEYLVTSTLPFRFERPPSRQPWRGLITSALGWIICFYGRWGLIRVALLSIYVFVTWPILRLTELLPADSLADLACPIIAVFIFALPSVVVPLFGLELLERGRRMREKDAISVLAKDHRAPVIYLRSFEDEDLIDPKMPSLFDFLRSLFLPKRYEPTLIKTLRRLGPVICIGKPGETYPEIGAARLYVSDSDWQVAVRYFLTQAAAVVVTVGRTEALWWEIHTVLSTLPLERILFFFPYSDKPRFRRSLLRKYLAFLLPAILTKKILGRMELDRQERYKIFRERAPSLLPMDLPHDIGAALFIDFSQDGAPRLLQTKRAIYAAIMWRFSKASWTQANLRRTLQPFFKKLEE